MAQTKIAELPKYMLFAIKGPGEPIENTPKLLPSVVGPSKLGFTAFLPPVDGGGWKAINFSFYAVQIEAEVPTIINMWNSEGTDAAEITIGASRPPIPDNPNRPTKGEITFGKTEKGICWIEIKAEGKGAQKFPFYPMQGSLLLRNGKEVNTNLSPRVASSWLTGFIKAASGLSNILSMENVKVFGDKDGDGDGARKESGGYNKKYDSKEKDIPY